MPQVPVRPNCDVSFFESFASNAAETYWQVTDAVNYTGVWHLEKTVFPRTRPDDMAAVTKKDACMLNMVYRHVFRNEICTLSVILVVHVKMYNVFQDDV